MTEADPVFYDTLFRKKRKNGTYKIVPAPQLEGAVADTHCHLGMVSHCDLSLARAAVYGVDFLCNVTDIVEDAGSTYAGLDGWKMGASAWLTEIAPDRFVSLPKIRLACGCHPHNAKDYTGFTDEKLQAKLRDPRTSCLGEVGLDYHYDLSPRDVQRRVFRRQIQLAHESGLPLALHIREAHDDALAIMQEEGFPTAGTILHCCSLSASELEPWIEAGCYIAYGGAITFASSDDAREAAKLVPEDRLLTETDCPYMTPVPLRGEENGPEYIIFTAERLAEVRGIEPGEERRKFLKTLHDNALGLLDRKPTEWQNAR